MTPQDERHTRLPAEELSQGVVAAFDSLLNAYREGGGHRFYGFNTVGDSRNYKGPLIWAEGDCAFRFAAALEMQFPGMVHLEMPVGKAFFADWSEEDTRQFVDIVVSDLRGFDAGRHEYARWGHDMFVEVKYIPKRLAARWQRDSFRTVAAILADGKRLRTLLAREGRCRSAAVLVVDDDDFLERAVFEREFDNHPSRTFQPPAFAWSDWPTEVPLLLVSGRQAARRSPTQTKLPLACPRCATPRIAPVVFGMPDLEVERAEERGEVLLGGCMRSGHGDDTVWGCIDCGHRD